MAQTPQQQIPYAPPYRAGLMPRLPEHPAALGDRRRQFPFFHLVHLFFGMIHLPGGYI